MKIHRIVFLSLCSLISVCLLASTYPSDIESVLRKSGQNRKELERAIEYFRKDKQKQEAIFFLIRNMDIHYSEYIEWKAPDGKTVPFNELEYPTYKEAVKAFKTNYSSATAYRQKTEDIHNVTADLLIDNVERAFKKWKSPIAAHLSFSDFCEYLLPYRSMTEKLDPTWRKKYENHFDHYFKQLNNPLTLATAISLYLDKTFFSTYAIDLNIFDILLSPSQILFRKQGGCEDLANYCLFILRSLGVATSYDFVPEWATSIGKHMWNTIISKNGRRISFTAGEKEIKEFKLKREPGKVIRCTYSKQEETVAAQLPSEKIPNSYMRLQNYIDVTSEYWPCKDIPLNLFPSQEKYAFITVFNGMQWRPVYYGRINNNKTVFRKMACGAIYLPMFYQDDELKNAYYPVLMDKKGNTLLLKINHQKKIDLRIPEKGQYLICRANKKYTLYYWDGEWIKSGEKEIEKERELSFSGLPSNTVYLLIPEYSQGKDRPFTVQSDGTLLYW